MALPRGAETKSNRSLITSDRTVTMPPSGGERELSHVGLSSTGFTPAQVGFGWNGHPERGNRLQTSLRNGRPWYPIPQDDGYRLSVCGCHRSDIFGIFQLSLREEHIESFRSVPSEKTLRRGIGSDRRRSALRLEPRVSVTRSYSVIAGSGGDPRAGYCWDPAVVLRLAMRAACRLVVPSTMAFTRMEKSSNRRVQIENLNGIVKDKNGLKDGWCRAFGLAAHNLGLLALLAAHNLRQTKRYHHRQQSTESNGHEPLPPTPAAAPPSAPSRNGQTARGPPH